jgi:hypothetical protein
MSERTAFDRSVVVVQRCRNNFGQTSPVVYFLY